MLSFLALATSLLRLSYGCMAEEPSCSAQRPNFLIIMADDQDRRMGSLDYQPLLQKAIRDRGTEFRSHYCTVAQCCPSRVSMWTGRAAHNTNVTDTRPPYGGWPQFIKEGHNDDYLPIWLQNAGYNTYYVGKMMNGLSVQNYDSPYPAGWNGTDFLVSPNLYQYYNASFQRNHDPPVYHPGEYSGDLVTRKALDYLDEAADAAINGGRPFFMVVSPIGPHSSAIILPDRPIFSLPEAAPRHRSLFANASVPRTPNFNPAAASGPASWLKDLPPLNASEVAYGDEFYRRRLQALQSVDELVDALVAKLDDDDDTGRRRRLADDTYVFYTSDNGFHIGQHRLPPGKSCGFEEDVLVPFFVRGPGVAENAVVDWPTTHTDVAPTIFELAGIGLRDDFDGVPMPVRDRDVEAARREGVGKSRRRYEHVTVEFWGEGQGEGMYAGPDTPNNTYKFLRIIGDSYSLAYSVWCTNEHELYDMNVSQLEE
ncbi:Arylsulfatase [Lasiodiplodia theobromae]|uniref:Arylsulfatase n=2 Tax=Lasiodiplodia theobromae TaxID=45133 RepID=A0A5N5CTY8_9PEZI|nr:Arylsulfatase [Lasiodiplodia theobromae]